MVVIRARIAMLIAISCSVGATDGYGQLAIPGAGQDKFGLIGGARSVTISSSDDGAALFWTTAKYKTAGECNQLPPHSPELFECLDTLTNAPWSYEFSIGLAGEKGKSSIASKGLFTPGFSTSASAKYRWERPRTKGYYDFYGTFSVITNPLWIATFPVAAADVSAAAPAGTAASIERGLEKRIGGAGGVNRFFNEHFALGGAVTLTRALSTPGERKPISLCQTLASSAAANGQIVEASQCHDGFVGPLASQWVNTYRLDALYNFSRYGLGERGRPVPVATFGLMASAQVSRRTDTPVSGNVAFGPVLHPKGVPHKALLALVFKVSDVTGALDDRTLQQRFSAALWFGIPLTGF
jgi:hypothetical protein